MRACEGVRGRVRACFTLTLYFATLYLVIIMEVLISPSLPHYYLHIPGLVSCSSLSQLFIQVKNPLLELPIFVAYV